MTDVAVTLFIPIDDIVDALEPRVALVMSQTRAVRPPKRKDLTKALINACGELAEAYTRYENGLGTRDEQPALKKVLLASTHVRRAFKGCKNQL
ncbi:hypothetical protein [Rhizobium sp. CECT 9324]|uniref:hypothetical protein n=1 Tax=Rhizobium sp. CECT 9324 TaxID=2845820 RepID=UPI001E5F8EC3|nr:hypothetical protein [Rhizobium sp. CECT 9324]CAH0339606.1 hypothetical protein RHI9324_01257 [Rhizobium sp. CECT 9324]